MAVTCPTCGTQFEPGDEVDSQDVKYIFSHYKQKILAKALLTDLARSKIKKRLTEFTPEELEQAIDNFSADTWWMKNNAHRGAAWFFKSRDRIAQFINLQPRGGLRTL